MSGRDRPPVQAHLRYQAEADHLRGRDLRGKFEYIYDTNLWDGEESRSGLGSDSSETVTLRRALPELLHAVGARSLLDLPCGDFRWMSRVDLAGIDYTGGDIVPSLIERNQAEFGDANHRFLCLDITADNLPAADVVLCRDCLVHLSFRNIAAALNQLRASNSRYLLTTTFTELTGNVDIEDGDWRMLNFEVPPFNFPPPIALIVEGCQEGGGAYADKSLGLWSICDFECL